LGEAEILFRKIEDEEIQPEIDRLRLSSPNKQSAPIVEEKKIEKIAIDDFGKIELRVAQVVAAEKVEKANKLLKLTIKLGEEERQIVAGIAEHYAPQDLIDKQIVIVANLQPPPSAASNPWHVAGRSG
jgi:methionyl-tRNA synthetase